MANKTIASVDANGNIHPLATADTGVVAGGLTVTGAMTAALVNGASATELGYLVGVTSALQTQLDAKQAGPLSGDVTTSGAASTVEAIGGVAVGADPFLQYLALGGREGGQVISDDVTANSLTAAQITSSGDVSVAGTASVGALTVTTVDGGVTTHNIFGADDDINLVNIGAKATGSIHAVASTGYVSGETITLDDGVNPPTTLTFGVDISLAVGSSSTMGTRIRNAINAASLDITGGGGGFTVTLTNDAYGAYNADITTTVVNPSFTVTGMSGGVNARGVFVYGTQFHSTAPGQFDSTLNVDGNLTVATSKILYTPSIQGNGGSGGDLFMEAPGGVLYVGVSATTEVSFGLGGGFGAGVPLITAATNEFVISRDAGNFTGAFTVNGPTTLTDVTIGASTDGGLYTGALIVQGLTTLANVTVTGAINGVSPTTFSYLDATSSVQGQLNAKAPSTSIALSALATQATLTIVGNSTGGTASPTALSVATVKTMLSLSGTNSGDVTLGAAGSTPNANGASLSTQVLTLQPADGTNPGIVSTTTQTFAGAKTFSGGVTHSSTSTMTGSVAFNGGATASGATSFDLSGSSATMLTPTGLLTFSGNAKPAAGKVVMTGSGFLAVTSNGVAIPTNTTLAFCTSSGGAYTIATIGNGPSDADTMIRFQGGSISGAITIGAGFTTRDSNFPSTTRITGSGAFIDVYWSYVQAKWYFAAYSGTGVAF